MAGDKLGHRGKNLLPRGFGSRPWLFQTYESNKNQSCTFLNLLNKSLEKRILPALKGKVCLGCYGEWLLLSDELTRECFFQSIISFSKIYIPTFPESPDFFRANVSITAPPNTTRCIIVLVYSEKTFLYICSPERKRWNKVPLRYFDHKTDSLLGASAIHNRQLFVVTTGEETLAIDVDPLVRGCVKMTVIEELRVCPVVSDWDTYLVKCAGNLFLVLVHCYGFAQGIIHVEVRRLEGSCNDMHWRRVQDIGDHAFFLAGSCGRSLPANKAWGTQRNCIYFPENYNEGLRLYKFCLDDQVLDFTLLPESKSGWNTIQWVFPMKKKQTAEEDIFNSSDVSKSEDTDSSIIGQEAEIERDTPRRWDELPIELLELLFSRLSLVDCLRFPSVCKEWSKASSFSRRGVIWPWLMHLPNLKFGSCKFFDPFNCKEYTLMSDAVVGACDHLALRFSKDGWVVATEGNKKIFMLNPFTGQVIKLPPAPTLPFKDYIFDGISFVSDPTSPDFVVYGFVFQICGEFVEISSWRPGEEEWTLFEFWPDIPFYPTSNNPVLFQGEYYCLGRKGELGVFNPELKTWNVLSEPEPIYPSVPQMENEFCHLLELDGDLISVFRTDELKKPIRVFKLNQSKMVWEKIEDLGNMTLFVDHRNSIAIRSPEEKYANRIYVTRFEGTDVKKGLFYSLEDKRYYPDIQRVVEPVTCVWMEPNLQIYK
ncbi:F-box protein family-like [Rhynchospora pubera]|uniref:F-box protein family-like n=1 Tax=Rhynchospora pubera TaxID=906938 RepID=A0AAV8FZ27_9POAL|nr:F-box protein family-like [Rhynchospora pubera]